MIKCFVKKFSCNNQQIENVDVLKYREADIKKFKKKSATKAEFAQMLREEFMRRYWLEAEHELIVIKTEDRRILLVPWCGCYNPEKATIDVTDDYSQLDWSAFADYHIDKQSFKTEATIDVYDQIMFGDRFDKLVDALWTTHLKYERDNSKFHQ